MVGAGQTALQGGQHAGGGVVRSGSAHEPAGGVEQHWNGNSVRGGILRCKVTHGLQDRVVDVVGEDQDGHARNLGASLPADLLVQAMFDGQISVARGKLGQPGLGFRFIGILGGSLRAGQERGHAIANGGVTIAPAHGGERKRRGNGVGGVSGKARQHLRGTHLGLDLVA